MSSNIINEINDENTQQISPDKQRPIIGVGSCLVAHPVRFNGGYKRKHMYIDRLKKHADLVPICPEMGIGLGVPRETIRLVDIDGELRARDSDTQTKDYTDKLKNYADEQLQRFPNLGGYILVKGSPSCGYERVTKYNEQGNGIGSDAAGIYAQRLMDQNPLLPVEEDGRLYDHALRESFVSRIYLYHDWQQLIASGLTFKKLSDFYSRNKYLVMAHSVPAYKEIGPLLANGKKHPLNELADKIILLMTNALKKVATRRSHTNVLHHLQGYLKNNLSQEEKKSLRSLIDQYREGIVPLIVPMTLLRHHFNHSPDEYIRNQVFMQPYPEDLALRSHLT
ncbi:MAG: DUF523 and DUF1722 domain-containing protein [Cellvibrionaceae bacterium]